MSNPYEVQSSSSTTTRELDYGYFTVAASIDIAASTTFKLADTAESVGGDVALGTNGISLIGGRTYEILWHPYFTAMSSTSFTLGIYNYTTSAQISNDVYIVAADNSGSVASCNSTGMIYTPTDDCEICGINLATTTATVYAGRTSLVVKEIVTTVAE